MDAIKRILANNNGEKECIIFAYDLVQAERDVIDFNGTIVASYPFISAFGAKIFAYSLEDISSLKSVKAITSEARVFTCGNFFNFPLNNSKLAQRRQNGAFVKIAATKEPISGMSVSAAVSGLDKIKDRGKGITVAIIDTGINPCFDFCAPTNRLVFKDFISDSLVPFDDNGHGTAVAGILAGNGLASFGEYCGALPNANIVSIKAIGGEGEGGAFEILKAMQWIYENRITLNISICCMSFGSTPQEKKDPLVIGAEALVACGITVIASAGNDGDLENTIKSPAISPRVIAVGALDKTVSPPKMAKFSSRGKLDDVDKPNVVAAGVKIISCFNEWYKAFSGTSMSAPIVAGMCGLILQKYPLFSPDEVRKILMDNAKKMDEPKNVSGAGEANIDFL